jgi:sugar lactone lactonase YvrE
MRPRLPLVLALLLAAARPGAGHPPQAGLVEVFGSVMGPEGLAFTRRGDLIVGTASGQLRRFAADGTSTALAELGEPLAGVTVLRDGRVLAASFGAGRVWAVTPDGSASVFASGLGGPNFIAETRSGWIYVSASSAGTIVELVRGAAVASGLSAPNGLAVGRDGFLYVAETAPGRVSRLPIAPDGSLGAAEVYATGLPVADGLAFDRQGNLLVAGADALWVIEARTRAVSTLSSDPLLDWPSNVAFGRGPGFRSRDAYLANFGFPLGGGTTLVRLRYNHGGARLAR